MPIISKEDAQRHLDMWLEAEAAVSTGQSYQIEQMMLTRASLKQAMAERFGAEARFHTCSASEMDAEALIDFLAARGKFIDSAEGFQTHADKICNHG